MPAALSAERLREVLSYCPGTGFFTWRMRTSNRVKAGGAAGSLNAGSGYIRLAVDGRYYQAHRLAWLYVHGHWPTDQLDHINGIRNDNRIENLREVTNAQNSQNVRPHKDGASKYVGVSWKAPNRKWIAQIAIEGRNTYLGSFATEEEAAAAYAAAKSKHHPFGTVKEAPCLQL